MPLAKKFIAYLFFLIFTFSLFSGCIFEDIIFGTNFTLKSWRISDEDGFPSLNISFSCSDTIIVNIVGPDSIVLDSDSFFIGNHNETFNLAEFRNSVKPGEYKLIAYDNKDSEIFSESFFFQGEILNIISCKQKWWKKDQWLGNYALLGLELYVTNNGDTPAYPYNLTYILDSQKNESLVLPEVILPGSREYIKCFTYENTTIGEKTLSVDLKNQNNNLLATEEFLVEVKENVPIEEVSWHYKGNRKRNVPKSEYLYDYYRSLDRIITDDYALYVFDPYDNKYIDVLLDCLLFGFSSTNIEEKINYIASMVQTIEYTSDSETDSTYEYPRYPVETLFDRKGDCEDKSILTASLLQSMGYEVALLRLPNHMAVGVKLSEESIPKYDFYAEDYYFLETTTTGKPCGFIPLENRNEISNLTIHTISSRPLIIHNWINDKIAIFKNTDMGDFVKVKLYLENLGSDDANYVKITAGFFDKNGNDINSESKIISILNPNSKKKVTLSVNIPKDEITWFKTRVYHDSDIVEEKQSASSFPVE